MSAPGQATKLTSLLLHPDYPLEMGITDAHGLWVVGADGVYLLNDTVFGAWHKCPAFR